jgi:hypothetical protein
MAESKIIEKAIEARVNACFLPAKPLPAGKINDQFTEHMKEKADEKKENPEPTFAYVCACVAAFLSNFRI